MPRGRAEDYKTNHAEEGETSDQKQSKYAGADRILISPRVWGCQ